MSFEDINKLIKQFEEGPNIIPSGSYSLSQKDIKQDEIALPSKEKIKDSSVNLTKNGNFVDNYADFTEFEDKNGNIKLIKYSDVIYEFRGNQYCKYILCDEISGSCEKGIAQIKNGQKVHITDPHRINNINAFISNSRNKVIQGRIKNHRQEVDISGTEYDTKIIGYIENEFKDKITIIYQILNYYKKNYLLKLNIPYSFEEMLKISLDFNHKDIQDKSYEDVCFGYSGPYDWFKEDLNMENFVKINDVELQIDNDTNTGSNTDKQVDIKENTYKIQKLFLILISFPVLLIFLYPIVEFILWICSHVLPLFWHDKFSSKAITDFAVQNLPYAFHPKFGWFKYLSINILCLITSGKSLYNIFWGFSKEKLLYSIIGLALSIFFIYSMFNPNIFDKLATFSAWAVIPVLLCIFN